MLSLIILSIIVGNTIGSPTGDVLDHNLNFRCPDQASGIVPHPTDCHLFVNCDRGRPFVQPCAPGTLFNRRLGQCDYPANTECVTGNDGQYEIQGNRENRQNWNNQRPGSWPNQGQYPTNGQLNYPNNGREQPCYDRDANWNQNQNQARPPIGDSRCRYPANNQYPSNNYPAQDQWREPGGGAVGAGIGAGIRPGLRPASGSGVRPIGSEQIRDSDYEWELQQRQQFANSQQMTYGWKKSSNIKRDVSEDGSSEGTPHVDFVTLNGTHPAQGLLTIHARHKTAYVCDRDLSISVANVTCRDLGFTGPLQITYENFNGTLDTTHDTFLVTVHCHGNETTVNDCEVKRLNQTACMFYKVPSIHCRTVAAPLCPRNYFTCTLTKDCVPLGLLCDDVEHCNDGSDEDPDRCRMANSWRLVDGSEVGNGLVQVERFGIKGNVCADRFDVVAARVLCKRLGFRFGNVLVDSRQVQSAGHMWSNRWACAGNESTVDECLHDDWIASDRCGGSAFVFCAGRPNERKGKSLNELFPKTCGVRFIPDSGYVGADKDLAPWHVSIRRGSKTASTHHCSGAIITATHVLTTSKCVTDHRDYFVRISSGYDGLKMDVNVKHIHVHDDYNHDENRAADVALLVLKDPVQFRNHLQPVCLRSLKNRLNKECMVSGWGSNRLGGMATSNFLITQRVGLVDKTNCSNDVSDGLKSDVICAESINDKPYDNCDGDYGNPLACMDDGFYTLYGIKSWDQECGYTDRPGLYTRIGDYLDWIRVKIYESTV